MSVRFSVLRKDNNTQARTGRIETVHGHIDTPVFIPVGTAGTVKALKPDDLERLGAEIILGNAYHLYLRPGHRLIEKFGGLHTFIGWDGPILTDSGGFQLYSLSPLRKIDEEGVTFRSHIDGSAHFLTPENVVEIQESLGADIIMTLDECVTYNAPYHYIKNSVKLTKIWAERCKKAINGGTSGIFGIVQGGIYKDLREEAAREVVDIGFDGYAIGGLSVGEPKEKLIEVVFHTTPMLPEVNPRYLMGVGTPEDIVESVSLGVDMFDCVIPTRNARNGKLFTSCGSITIKNSKYTHDTRPVDEHCGCYTCMKFSRAYLRHLYISKEILSSILNTIHNVYYYVNLMKQMRNAINSNTFTEFRREFFAKRDNEKRDNDL